jgi:PAS domain S-box-containing protein
MSQAPMNHEDPRLTEMLEVIFRFAAGDYTARGVVSGDNSALDGVMGGINILGEELQAKVIEAGQAQQALAESEALLRTIFDSLQDGIIMAESESRRFRMVNAAMCRMLGYSSDELLSLGVEGIHPEEGLPEVASQFELLARGKIGIATNLPMLRKDGSIFYADVNAGQMLVDGVPCLVGVFRDITERRASEEKIRQLNEALENKVQQLTVAQHALLQHQAHLEEEVARQTASLTEAQRIAHVGSWEWHISNNTLNWSDEVYRIFGLPLKQSDLTYEDFLGVVHPDDRLLVEQTVNETLDGLHSYNLDHRILQPDGTLRYVHEQAELIRGDNGQPVRMVGTVQDITVRKQAEEAIRASRDLLQTIVENAPIRVFWKDTALRYLGCNTLFARDAGRSGPEDMIGKDDFQMVWHDQAERYRADDRMVMETDEPRIGFEEPQTTPDGRTIWLRTSKVPLHDAAGKVFGVVGIYDDITESKHTEEKIRKLNEELELKVQERTRQLLEAQEDLVRKEKLATLGQVAGIVGHELRNPLGVMNNAVYFLQTVLTEADETTRDYLGIIKDEIIHADRIVGDLLDSVRTKPPQTVSVSVEEMIGQTLNSCKIPDSIEVKLDIPAALAPLWVDAQQIQQVFRNLISNGLEAMPEGGTLQIRAVDNEQGETIAVSIQDTGNGMTPEQMEHLFQPLYTTKARGIGLGLMVVKNLTRANGGEVTVQSEHGRGTTFTVTLPASRAPAGGI